ncbi:MAG: hypothetical protein M3P48_07605 [Actinomycetota bacterium]|nr:hypothetical protein [Actinomycetota bacterium]
MGDVVAFPAAGAVFFDARGAERAMRISSHEEAGVLVLSLWRDDLCAATFRLPIEHAASFVAAVVDLVATPRRAGSAVAEGTG